DLANRGQGGIEGVQHAFGIARRSRREGHTEYFICRHARAFPGGKWASLGNPALEVPLAVDRFASKHHMRQRWDRLPQLSGQANVVEALEARRADESLAAREAQNVVELADAEIGVHLVGNRPDELKRKEHDRKGDAVRQLDGNDVAALDADPAQKLSATFDL